MKSMKSPSREGLSLLDVCGTSSDGSSRSSSDDGSAEAPMKSSQLPGSSIQRKFVDMLSPLLVGSTRPKHLAPIAPQDANTGRANLLAGQQAECKDKNPRATSTRAGLLEYVSKMAISDVFAGKSDKDAGRHAPTQADELEKMPSLITPSLERLLSAARHCNLPPSPRCPEPGTPNYPTIMLSMSLSLPPSMQRKNWCLHDYAVTEKLYTGYASTVYKALCKTSGQTVVLKVYTLTAVCDLYKYQIYREIRVHSALQHENIVHLYSAFQEGDKIIMVEEYADGSDLFTLLHKYGGRMSERLAVQMVLEPFLKVLDYLHSKGIVHRDIKPENIMFNRKMVLKLGDFGLAVDMRTERAVTRAGTLDYMAPEVLKCPFKSRPEENKDNAALHYGPRVDSWALGVMAYELLVGFPPFYDQNRKNTEELIKKKTPVMPPSLTEEARDFLEKSLSKNVHERPSIRDMVHHEWIESYRTKRQLGTGQPSTPVKDAPSPVKPPATPSPLRESSSLLPSLSSSASMRAAAPTPTQPSSASSQSQAQHTPVQKAPCASSHMLSPVQMSALKLPSTPPQSPGQGHVRTPYPDSMRIPLLRTTSSKPVPTHIRNRTGRSSYVSRPGNPGPRKGGRPWAGAGRGPGPGRHGAPGLSWAAPGRGSRPTTSWVFTKWRDLYRPQTAHRQFC
eukprot:gene20296-27053_t